MEQTLLISAAQLLRTGLRTADSIHGGTVQFFSEGQWHGGTQSRHHHLRLRVRLHQQQWLPLPIALPALRALRKSFGCTRKQHSRHFHH
uniref:Uncharacterized protein n=1 Tax=Arundo donax TaxID=35708 RepID=A0A0A9A4W5_ARUDO